jgi:hypothetical protein
MTTDRVRARELDVTRPTAARLYDYFPGGTAHYDVDKIFAEHRKTPRGGHVVSPSPACPVREGS